ncbi:MAG TPA: TolC family protein [Candidatus Acidoferrum sp.]|nr:TolC family protein [Candidatus Acidoferrum sp.]
MTKRNPLFCWLLALLCAGPLSAQEAKSRETRHLTLEEAVQLALKHNHVVRIAAFSVQEKEHTKDVARSAYFPLLRNDSTLAHLTDTQFIGVPAGGFGTVGGTPVPTQSTILNQGGLTAVTSGTSLTQPLSGLWKIKSANDVAAAELNATRGKARQTENEVALRVHQLYYRILILQSHKEAAAAKIQAIDALQAERVQQVKFGSALGEEAIESRAQSLESKQDLLTTDLQLSDLTMQLDDAMGLPLTTPLALDPGVRQVANTCEREQCLRSALEAHPEITEAQAKVEQASAAVRLAKRQYIPDVEAFARYSYADNVPFLVHNFGIFGVHLGYDLFDGGRRNAAIAEHKSQLSQAEENLARVKEEVELRAQTAYNKLERTRQMMKVSEELLALRTESHRVSVQQLQEGSALHSQTEMAAARELEAKTLFLQSQLEYIQANDEMTEAIGQTPE